MKRPSLKAFQKAFNAGEIVRFHLMRSTWQLASAEDYWPFLQLCAPKAIAVIKGWMASNRISIPDDELFRIREILCQIVADRRSACKEDIAQGLEERDIKMDDHRLSYHIRMAELDGVLCSGDLLPMRASYALSAHKMPPPRMPWTMRSSAINNSCDTNHDSISIHFITMEIVHIIALFLGGAERIHNNGDCAHAWFHSFNYLGSFTYDLKKRGGFDNNYVRPVLAF